MEQEEFSIYPSKPEIDVGQPTNYVSTLVSLGVFMLVFGLIFQDTTVLFMVVLVLFIHEMGHFLTMQWFGYHDVNLTFIPLMGAVVTGEKDKTSQFQRAIILLAGPVPGILIGYGLIEYGMYLDAHENLIIAGITFMFINVLNLIPLDPLDGGKLIETLFFSANKKVKVVFFVLSIIGMAFLAFLLQEWFFLIIIVFMLMRLRNTKSIAKIRGLIGAAGISIQKSYNELSDGEYWKIRNLYVKTFNLQEKIENAPVPPEEFEMVIAKTVRSILITPISKDLSAFWFLTVLAIWISALILPLMYAWPVLKMLY